MNSARTVANFVEKELNPHVRTWEDAGRFPIHEVFKKMGELGLLGVTKPTEYGGQGLDYSYGMVMAEEMGAWRCGGVPLAVGCRPTWPRRLSRASAATSCGRSSWLRPSPATWWRPSP
jgi:alkylation response protein AidB-like acyl-CoA dehydrogenase